MSFYATGRLQIRKSTGDPRYQAGIGKTSRSIAHTILGSCTWPFQLLILEPMLLLLCIFTAFLAGIVSLSRAISLVFLNVYHSPCNILAGLSLAHYQDGPWDLGRPALATQLHPPRTAPRTSPSPDSASPPAIVGSILVPSAIHIHWSLPVIGSAVYGAGTLLAFTSVFTFTFEACPVYATSARGKLAC